MMKDGQVYATITILLMPLVFVATLAIVPSPVVAAQEGDYIYTLSGDPSVAMITGYNGPGGAITIPSTLGGHPVVAIGYQAFYYRTSLTSVSIPGGISSIGESAFALCTSLASVSISNGLASIGNWSFSSCTGLTSISIPNSVITIGDWAFESCTSIATITIPDGVTSIGDWCFDYCSSLTSVTVGRSIEYIGSYAFNRCSLLASINFLSLSAPAYVDLGWLDGTSSGIRGHAYAASDFPGPGEVWNGLTMGEVIPAGGVPGLPQNLQANGRNAQIVLTWQAPTDVGDSPISSYRLYRSTASDGTYSVVGSSTGLTYTDSGLTVGQTYWYKVTAVNAIGEGDQSNAVSALVPPPSSDGGDSTLILVVVVAVVAVIVAILLYQRRSKPKKEEPQRKSKRK